MGRAHRRHRRGLHPNPPEGSGARRERHARPGGAGLKTVPEVLASRGRLLGGQRPPAWSHRAIFMTTEMLDGRGTFHRRDDHSRGGGRRRPGDQGTGFGHPASFPLFFFFFFPPWRREIERGQVLVWPGPLAAAGRRPRPRFAGHAWPAGHGSSRSRSTNSLHLDDLRPWSDWQGQGRRRDLPSESAGAVS